MATEINEAEELTLKDKSKVTVQPLNIKLLRRFMKEVGKMQGLESDIEGIDIMFRASAISLQGSDRPELGDVFVKSNNKDTEEVDEEKGGKLEELLDLPLIREITRIAGGLSDDPNQPARGLPGKS